MRFEIVVYILVMAVVTYLIRMLPITLIRKEITNVYIKSFLYYVPFVTLAVMTFPAILYLDGISTIWPGMAGFVVAVVLAFFGQSLFKVSIAACAMVFITEFLISELIK